MNILLLHQYFLEEDGAGGARFNEMARIWTEKGHNVTVLAGMMPDHKGNKRPEYKNKKFFFKKHGLVEVYRCHVSESYNRNFLGRLLGYASFCFYSLWAGLFKLKDKYDFILVTSPPIFVGIVALAISKTRRIPLVFEVRDLWPESAIDTGVIRNKLIINFAFWFERLCYNHSKLINVLTPAFRKILIKRKEIDGNKVIYIPNGADLTLSDQIMKNFNADDFRKEKGIDDKFVIVYVGAHGLANGLQLILDTAQLLTNTNVLFILIGKGMKRDQLIRESKKRGIQNIRFVEPLPKTEVFKYILASQIGTSVLIKNDTFKTIYSNKTFDYMSCKKPVLMAIDGISRELIEESDAGMYVEPENAEDFANKIRFYLKNPGLLKKQGENGYFFVKKHFDREKLARKYLEKLKLMNEVSNVQEIDKNNFR